MFKWMQYYLKFMFIWFFMISYIFLFFYFFVFFIFSFRVLSVDWCARLHRNYRSQNKLQFGNSEIRKIKLTNSEFRKIMYLNSRFLIIWFIYCSFRGYLLNPKLTGTYRGFVGFLVKLQFCPIAKKAKLPELTGPQNSGNQFGTSVLEKYTNYFYLNYIYWFCNLFINCLICRVSLFWRSIVEP